MIWMPPEIWPSAPWLQRTAGARVERVERAVVGADVDRRPMPGSSATAAEE